MEVQQDVISQDDQQMSQAIEASLHFEMSQDGYEEIHLEERVRKGYRSVSAHVLSGLCLNHPQSSSAEAYASDVCVRGAAVARAVFCPTSA